MPFKDIIYSASKETEKILEKALGLSKQIKASNSVFHPNSIADYKLINEFSWKPCIENMDKKPKYTGYYYPKEIGKILAKNPKLGLCIDRRNTKTKSPACDRSPFFQRKKTPNQKRN